MSMSAATDRPTNIALHFGFDQYFALAGAGLLGIIPNAAWLVSLSRLAWTLPMPSGVIGLVIEAGLFVLALILLLVAPPLVPCLVLRARQPRGACLAWDDDGIVEREGDQQRTFIPWKNAEAARVTWDVPVGRGKRACTAIQVFDRVTDDVVTVWEDRPRDAPVVRRRLIARKTEPLATVLARKGVSFDRHADWMRVVDPARARPSNGVLAITRLGYVGGALAPLIAFAAPAWGMGCGVASALLLAWRARSSVAELILLWTHTKSVTTAFEGPREDPYRTAQRRPFAHDEGPAERERLGAVMLEVAVRSACVVLPVAASLANALTASP
jgi:hypothetical protein